MDALLVFPYFLVKLLMRMGAESEVAEWGGAILSCVCLVTVMMAPFHPRDGFKTSMAGISWLVIVMASVGCAWECREAQASAGSRVVSQLTPEIKVPLRRVVVDLGEA